MLGRLERQPPANAVNDFGQVRVDVKRGSAPRAPAHRPGRQGNERNARAAQVNDSAIRLVKIDQRLETEFHALNYTTRKGFLIT